MEAKTELLFICIADRRIHTLKGSFQSMSKKGHFHGIDSDIEFNEITANLVFQRNINKEINKIQFMKDRFIYYMFSFHFHLH